MLSGANAVDNFQIECIPRLVIKLNVYFSFINPGFYFPSLEFHISCKK